MQAIPIISDLARSTDFRQYLVDLLVGLCEHDTTIRSDVAALGKAEQAVFDLIEKHLAQYNLPGRVDKRPIDPKIADHPFFSQLYYTQSKENPTGLTVDQTYKDRANLFYLIDGTGQGDGVNLAINAHIDVVPPYFPPRVEGDTVYGRGACDDKGNVAAMMGALKLVGRYLEQSGKQLGRHLTCMFVIEEEMGGNGSLAAAIDRDLKSRYDSLMVMEICESKLYPGNRGCVWYKIEAKVPGVNLFEASAYIVEQLEKEGRALRSESDHPLFPHRPVQTCHGIIGHVGEHPSRINGDVSFDIRLGGGDPAKAEKTLRDNIDFALAEYIGVYGDKTKVIDKGSGKPKVDHHFDFTPIDGGFRVRVYGATGHMGSIFENDGAITKMASFVRAIHRSKSFIEKTAGGTLSMHLTGWDEDSHLTMEGGQGFLPTHEMEDVQSRLQQAVVRGAEIYFRAIGHDPADAGCFKTSYDKLHNAAFAGQADSPDMRNAVACAKAVGMWKDEDYAQGIRGWDVSCDSRIFAKEYEDLTVITSGPGSLNYAHSDLEQIDIPEMIKFAEFLAHYILKQTGTV